MQTSRIQDSLKFLNINSEAKDDDEAKYEDCEAAAAADDHSLDEDEEDEDEDDGEEFSFMCGGPNTSPIAAEDAFINGQIKTLNGNSLFSGDDSGVLHENLPMRPPVKKVFVETREANGPGTSSAAESHRESGPARDWSDRKVVEASPEICKKSNSTGFSKIWRFKDLLGRSNSDGRDAFVFLNNGEQPAAGKGEEKSEREATVKVSGRKVKKGKTASLSAHEAYLKSKAKVEERRRSYLPYRPELMGFFTNVNGGLTKNVHPF